MMLFLTFLEYLVYGIFAYFYLISNRYRLTYWFSGAYGLSLCVWGNGGQPCRYTLCVANENHQDKGLHIQQYAVFDMNKIISRSTGLQTPFPTDSSTCLIVCLICKIVFHLLSSQLSL